jgi:hypothetical protein
VRDLLFAGPKQRFEPGVHVNPLFTPGKPSASGRERTPWATAPNETFMTDLVTKRVLMSMGSVNESRAIG